jgi:hypothetical protein
VWDRSRNEIGRSDLRQGEHHTSSLFMLVEEKRKRRLREMMKLNK